MGAGASTPAQEATLKDFEEDLNVKRVLKEMDLSHEDVKVFYGVFMTINKHGDGRIDRREFFTGPQ